MPSSDGLSQQAPRRMSPSKLPTCLDTATSVIYPRDVLIRTVSSSSFFSLSLLAYLAGCQAEPPTQSSPLHPESTISEEADEAEEWSSSGASSSSTGILEEPGGGNLQSQSAAHGPPTPPTGALCCLRDLSTNPGTDSDDECSTDMTFCTGIWATYKGTRTVWCEPCEHTDCEGWTLHSGNKDYPYYCQGIATRFTANGVLVENDCDTPGECTPDQCMACPLDAGDLEPPLGPYRCGSATDQCQNWNLTGSDVVMCCPLSNGTPNTDDCHPADAQGNCPALVSSATWGAYTCEGVAGTSGSHPPCHGWELHDYEYSNYSVERSAHRSTDCGRETPDGCYEMGYECQGVLYNHPSGTQVGLTVNLGNCGS